MMLEERNARRLIIAAAVVGLALRLWFALFYWVDKPLTHDEQEYLALARGLASGAGFVYDDAIETGTAQQFGRAPGYPLLLAALDAGRPVPTTAPRRVKIAQSALGAGAVVLIGVLAWMIAGPRAAVAAAAITAFYPPLIVLSSYVLSETLFCVLALASAIALQRTADRAPTEARGGTTGRTVALALAAGVLTGTAMLVRPAMLFFVPLALAWLLLRARPALAAAMLAAIAVVIAPWTMRNLRVHERFVLIASEGGVTFWTGNHPLARGEGDLAANPELKRAELAFRAAHPGIEPEALEPLYYQEAFHWIAEHPAAWAGLLGRKAFYAVVPAGPSYALHSARYRAVSIVPYLVVLPFAVAGGRRLWRSSGRPVALFLLAASSILVSLVFFPQERFRVPIIDPVLIVSAAALAARPQS